jgi:hypothetical protein
MCEKRDVVAEEENTEERTTVCGFGPLGAGASGGGGKRVLGHLAGNNFSGADSGGWREGAGA